MPANNRVLLQSSERDREICEVALLHCCSQVADARENAGPRGRTGELLSPLEVRLRIDPPVKFRESQSGREFLLCGELLCV